MHIVLFYNLLNGIHIAHVKVDGNINSIGFEKCMYLHLINRFLRNTCYFPFYENILRTAQLKFPERIPNLVSVHDFVRVEFYK